METTEAATDADSMGRAKVPAERRGKRTSRRGRPPLKDPRKKVIPVRVNEREWTGLAAAGEANGNLSPGSYLAEVGRAAAANRPLLPVSVIHELVRTRRQVQHVGRNVNQIAAAMNSGKDAPANTAAVMARLQQSLDRLDVAVDAVAARFEGSGS